MVNDVTKYFRSALLAQNQGIIDFKNSELGFEIIKKNEFNNGIVSLDTYKRLKSQQKDKNENNDDLKVIIIPKTIKSKFLDSKRVNDNIEELTGIFYIPAILNYKGELEINKSDGKWPWIPREFLQPMIESELSLGTVEDIDNFFQSTTDERVKVSNWNSYIEYIKKMYKKVIKSEFYCNHIEIDDEEIYLEENMYIILDKTVAATFHVKRIYENILNDKSDKALYRKFVQPSIEKKKELIPNDSYKKMINHVGQMGGEYPLAESQREAINHLDEIKDGDILAVSGPPGTGKTTLLQSVVANLYVKSALEEKEAPVIVASSTNNQAVTNIIDSFGSISIINISNLEKDG